MACHERITQLTMRLLGDRVSRRTAWQIARERGWGSLREAEYPAVAALQADAFATVDPDMVGKAGTSCASRRSPSSSPPGSSSTEGPRSDSRRSVRLSWATVVVASVRCHRGSSGAPRPLVGCAFWSPFADLPASRSI